MTITRVQLVGNVSTGASFSGIVTATSFSGNVTGNATGLSGTPNITVANVTGSAATFTNLTVNGTQTIINTTSLEIADKTVGIASTSSPTDANADGAGIVVYGTTNKSLTWNNTSKNWGLVGGGLTVASGPFIVGSATSTGTASQTLQVTGGAYVSGNLGVGITNPQTNLHIFTGDSTKGIRLQRFAGAYYSEIIHTDLPEGLSFKVGDGSTVTEKVRIVGSNGNLGIATTSPTSRLHVVGDALISGVVTATSYRGDGSQLTGVSAGIQTEALVASGIVTTLNLTKQDHKVTATGITTITVSGGTEGDSHTVRIVNSGIATVGFSTYFLFPSGSPPVLPTTSGAISLISFTVHRVGTAGTQLLAGASLNFS